MSFVVQSKEITSERIQAPYTTYSDTPNSRTEQYLVYYIVEDSEPIAYAIIDSRPNVHGLYKLYIIEVKEKYRMKGVGRYLVNHVVKIYKEIYLDSVSESVGFWVNIGAKSLITIFMVQVFLFSERSIDDVRALFNVVTAAYTN